jgi:hypothetical protein
MAEPIGELAAGWADDDDPSLTGDLLEIYFKSDRSRPGDFDIWRAKRGAIDQPWSEPERVDEVSSSFYEATPEVSLDGLVLFLASARPGGEGGSDIWMSTRAKRSAAWSAPVRVPELSSGRDEWAAVTDAELTGVVITRSVPGRSLDLFGSARASADDEWSEPERLANLSSETYEADAHLDPDGLRVTFAGEREGDTGRDLFQAYRRNIDADFATPERLVELSSASRDEDPWLSPDGKVIVFSSDRTGDQELYWATR